VTMPPIPDPDSASRSFFAALDEGRLELQRCTSCGIMHLAVQVCDACGSDRFDAVNATGEGTIHSFTRMHIAHHQAFAERLPVAAGIVELAEGPRLFAPLLGGEAFAIGMPVQLVIQTYDGRGLAAFAQRTENLP
jgi:uncharacterized protein